MLVLLMFLRGLCVVLMYPQIAVGVLIVVVRLLGSPDQLALPCNPLPGCQSTLLFHPVVTLVSLWITKF